MSALEELKTKKWHELNNVETIVVFFDNEYGVENDGDRDRAEKAAAELATLRARVAELEAGNDASTLRLMDEVEMRYGIHEDRWSILRGILETGKVGA